MTTEQTEALVLCDADGNYYVIPLDVIDSYRVPDDEKAGLGELVTGQEVSGSFEGAGRSWAVMSGYYIPELALQEYMSSRSGHNPDRPDAGERGRR
jgi:hypothetical protein